MKPEAIITNDAVVAAILFALLIFIFQLAKSSNKLIEGFFKIFPPILLCYFLPGVLNTFGLISGESSGVYPFVSKYLLPACLLLFTLSLDVEMLKKLGLKALLVFLAGTLGVIIGGPLAVKIVSSFKPEIFYTGTENEVWRGLGTIAGSWIGGGANQTALKEILQPSAYVFSQCVAVDVLVAETWLAVLLIGVVNNHKINKWLGADSAVVEEMKEKISALKDQKERIPTFDDYLKLTAVAFVFTGISYFLADMISPFIKENYPYLEKFSLTSNFFWVVFFITIFGVLVSRTKLRELEYVGASKIGTLFLYILVASIGMQMDLSAVADNKWLFLVGLIWISIHVIFVVLASKLLKAPFFMLAVGSQANIGGAASASVVAGAFHPALVPIGVIFAVLGYAIGTYGGYLTALLMHWVLS
ncbi:DUF819 domain-containing protein [Lacihabitans sp. CS3-21]|uniref:DUF819 family protein n=1 Tax=Lacihabitans sp. CS3-21 TaxID=2487332 RepID=UPI0020CDF854|nr:DUF819 family protein [Lacihabitans sp. CS3-21]MCP9748120.1 DUF819 family protein [Lacihabitans sp. CS3-21]